MEPLKSASGRQDSEVAAALWSDMAVNSFRQSAGKADGGQQIFTMTF
jgi:hypothetical protein